MPRDHERIHKGRTLTKTWLSLSAFTVAKKKNYVGVDGVEEDDDGDRGTARHNANQFTSTTWIWY